MLRKYLHEKNCMVQQSIYYIAWPRLAYAFKDLFSTSICQGLSRYGWCHMHFYRKLASVSIAFLQLKLR